jgi:import receptor subunit TOM22
VELPQESSSRSFETISESTVSSEDTTAPVASSALESSDYVITNGDDPPVTCAPDDGPASLSSAEVDQMNREIGMYMNAIDQAMLNNGAGDVSFPNVALSALESEPVDLPMFAPPIPEGDLVRRARGISSGSVPGDDHNNGDIDDDEDDFEDETWMERLWGLTEMFPEFARNGAGVTMSAALTASVFSYTWGRKALWVGSTSFIVLLLPFIVETERVTMEKENVNNQQQILLGPSSSLPGKQGSGMMPMPAIS